LNKEVFPIDEDFLDAVSNLPNCSGIAIGLDRLLMVALGKKSLSEISPYLND
jgi:elongation factor P--(R)-beta-lysine ligase